MLESFGNRRFGGSGSVPTVSRERFCKRLGIVVFSLSLCALPRAGGAAAVEPRPIHPETALTRAGEAAVVIVHPVAWEGAAYRALAERIADAIEARGGARPDILPDTAVTEARHPVLLEAYRERNLILLGRLGINRAIWGVYNRFLCAVDGYYPGGDGYVVRTAANVYGTGANTIIAGGSSEAGAARAVERLIAHIAETPPDDRGDLVLPWLLDVELDGECKQVFDRDEARQQATVWQPGSHAAYPPRRFYVNAMSYYWSGRDTYLALAREFLSKSLETDGMVAGHYGMEFFVRAWDMLDDSGLFTKAEIAEVDSAIIRTFDIYTTDPRQSSARVGISNPRTHVRSIGRHSVCSWLSDKAMADFILSRLPATPETERIRRDARSRQALYNTFLGRLIGERWQGDGSISSGGQCISALYRYGLENDRYAQLFDSGNVRRAAIYMLKRLMPNGFDVTLAASEATLRSNWRVFTGLAASYHGDGQMRAAMEMIPERPEQSGVHYDYYVNGVHLYMPGDEVESLAPDSLVGASVIPHEPTYHLDRVEKNLTALPYEQTFNFASFRTGFGPDVKAMLLLSGGRDLAPNIIVQLVLNGRRLLYHSPPDKGYYFQNALSINRLSRWQGTQASYGDPLATTDARLEHCLNLEGSAFISSTLPEYEDTRWTRDILYLDNRFFLVQDRVTAEQPDDYQIMANWWPGRGRVEGNRWMGIDGAVVISPPGENIRMFADVEYNRVTDARQPVFRQRATVRLAEGETMEIANLVFVRNGDDDDDYRFRRHSSGALLVRSVTDGRIYLLGSVPAALGESDAAMLALWPERALVFNGARLMIGETSLLDSAQPVSKSIDTARSANAISKTLQMLWLESEKTPPATTAADAVVAEDPAQVTPAWRYEGARRPAGEILDPRLIDTNTWDLGYVAELTDIIATATLSPRQILIRADEQEEWRQFEGETYEVDRLFMGQYGVGTRFAKIEGVRGKPQKARFVHLLWSRTLRENILRCYDSSTPRSSDPVRTIVADLRGQGKPDVLVVPETSPAFRSWNYYRWHDIIVLDGEGNESWKKEMPVRILSTPQALKWDGTGGKHIFVASLDGNMYVYDADGKPALTLPPDARDRIPSSVGLWQPDAKGRRKIVVGRYCSHSFFGRDGSLEHDARSYAYWTTDTLSYGIDFTGDGIEDTVSLVRDGLIPITQGGIEHPERTLIRIPRLGGNISGSPTLVFGIYEGTRLLLVRENQMGIRDLADNDRWTATWLPSVPLTAALPLPEDRQILCATRDGLLWRFSLDENFEIESASSVPLAPAVRRLTLLDQDNGAVLAATEAGLLLIAADNTVTRLVKGDFTDVDILRGRHPDYTVVAAEQDGAVNAFHIRH